MAPKVQDHLKSEEVKVFMKETKCPLNEAGAVLYYSCGRISQIINPLLAKGNNHDLKPWQTFLYYLCSAEAKLPTLENPRVYKEMPTTLHFQYPLGHRIFWSEFTTATAKRKAMEDPQFQRGKGTNLLSNLN